MKVIFFVFLVLQFNISKAGHNPSFYINPENLIQNQNATVNIWLGYSICNTLLLEANGLLKTNFIIEGNTIKLLTYYENTNFCPPIAPIPVIPYQIEGFNIPVGNYILELHTLIDGTPFPLPQNFVLNLQASLQFQLNSPVVIDSLSIFNIFLLLLVIIISGLRNFLRFNS